MDTHEGWKMIEEVNGIYSISNQGRVRNNRTGYILKPIKWTKGYMKVNLKVNGNSDSQMIHRLVAMAFIPNPENKPEVNHKNGIHDDNRVENLEWVTGEENRKHAYDTGLQRHKDERYSGYLYHLWKRVHRDMCEEWQNYLVFYDWCHKNKYSEGKYITRRNVRKEYDANNCYITTSIPHPTMVKERRKRAFVCFGKLMTVEEIHEKYNVLPETLIYRIKKGLSVEDAILMPRSNKGRPRKSAYENNK